MKQHPCLMFYCQHSLGMGHLIRSLALAKALINRFRVVFLNGGRIPEGIPFPDQIERIDMPPLGMDEAGRLVNLSPGIPLGMVKRVRRNQLQKAFATALPDVLLIELFPFGRKKFAYELLPLLKAARRAQPRPVVVCSLRDILVNHRRDQQRHDDRARWLADRYFDAVLVHSDPAFVRLEHSFKPARNLGTPVFHTGFVVPRKSPSDSMAGEGNAGLVVSAGGGIVGEKLLRCAVEAYPRIREHHAVPMTLITGPFLPESIQGGLENLGHGLPDLRIVRSVPDLQAVLGNATASISQCGYNTAMDVLRTNVPALFVPFSTQRENEQLRRAQLLASHGIARYLPESRLTPDTLAEAAIQLLDFRPWPHRLDLDGASRTCALICGLLDRVRAGSHDDRVA